MGKDEVIRRLQQEAGEAGDSLMVAICQVAMGSRSVALRKEVTRGLRIRKGWCAVDGSGPVRSGWVRGRPPGREEYLGRTLRDVCRDECIRVLGQRLQGD